MLRRRTRLGTTKLLQKFDIGDKVCIDLQSGYTGMPHPRYRGRSGTVIGRQGEAYVVEIKDMNARKKLIITGVHLKK